jgi:Flp pilus assembly protein protease CpaA
MQFSDWTSMHLGAIDIGSFVIPNWYIIALALVTVAYYWAFRKHDEVERD